MLQQHRSLLRYLSLIAASFVYVIAAHAPAHAQDLRPIIPSLPISAGATLSPTQPVSVTDPLDALRTPLYATPPIEYPTSFAEIECPFVPPWNQQIICGELEVPENRADAKSQGISLFVAILKSTGRPEIDPVFVIPDGPGQDGASLRSLFYAAPLRSNRDVILMDPRGTGYSSPALDCPELETVAQAGAPVVQAYAACFARLRSEGSDLSAYTSAAQVADIADLAQVLGIGSLNIYATGYGTRVAALLADKHPNLVRSMVLDGVQPIAALALLEEPLNLYSAVQRVAQECSAVPACNAAYPALEARLLEVIDRYNAKPSTVGYGSGDAILALLVKRLAQGGAPIPAFITALFDDEFAAACALLPPAGGCTLPTSAAAAIEAARIAHTQAAGAAAPGDTGWRALLPTAADPAGPEVEVVSWLMRTLNYKTPAELFAYLDTLQPAEVKALLAEAPAARVDTISAGVAASILCAEEAPFYTLDDLRRVAARIPAQFGILPGAHAATVLSICANWPVPPGAASERLTLPILAPVLLVNGTLDAQTPPTWARRAAAGMEQSRVQLFPGYGHGLLASGDDCLPAMMQLFYANPGGAERAACAGAVAQNFLLPQDAATP